MTMSRQLRIVLIACCACISALLARAQDGSLDRYSNTPNSRASDGAFVLGRPEADVKLIAFSDFLCTSCQNYEPIIRRFIQHYVETGKAQFEYRIYPVIDPALSVHSASLVECADRFRPGQFWRARDLMFDLVSTRGYTEESIRAFADALQQDPAALAECAKDASQYEIDVRYGLTLGASTAPALLVQYGDAKPLPIALALPEHHDAIVNAIRPATSSPVLIEKGRYAGLNTFRRADGGFVLGDPQAPITIVAFEDFLCPHCQNYQTNVDALIEEYLRTGVAQFEFRFYPLVNPQYSTSMAKTAECVAAQDLTRFWDGHDLLFEFARRGTLENLIADTAGLLELDADALGACVDRSIQFLIDTQLAQSAFVSGTPAIRARQNGGSLELIYLGEQPIDRGAPTIFQLRDLLEGAGNVSIGPPDFSSLADSFLVDTSLMTGEPCAPPCWQNIVPGETSMEDARAIVEAAGYGVIANVRSGFQFANETGIACCEIGHHLGIDGTVSESVAVILLRLAPINELGEVIAIYGEPSAVYTPDPGQAPQDQLSLVFAEARMILTVLVESADEPVRPNSKVVDIAYFSGDPMDQIMQLMSTKPLWQGYLSPNAYRERAAAGD